MIHNQAARWQCAYAGGCCLLLALASGAAANEWSGESPLPKETPASACVGGVPNNMATLPSGRTYIVYKETTGSTSTFKLAWTDDSGTHWGGPMLFAPYPGVPVGGLPSVVACPSGMLHFSWATTTNLYYVRLDPGTNAFSDFAQVAGAADVVAFNQITCDQSGALHIVWHCGNAEATTGLAAEVFYARRAAGDTAFGAAVRLSADDGRHSAFPNMDSSGASGGILAVAWRDAAGAPYVPGMDGDVIARVSTNGGASWEPQQTIASGSDRQFDPIVVIDQHDRIPLAHHAYPGSPPDPNANYVLRGYSSDTGATWRSAGGGTGLARVSPEGENHSLCKAAYDRAHDIVWYFWKMRTGAGEDIMAQPVYRGGDTLGALENITGFTGTAAAAFHNFSAGVDGRVCAHYHRSESDPLHPFTQATIFYRERALPSPVMPRLTPTLQAGGSLQVTWESEYGVMYSLYTSTNLSVWQPWSGGIITGMLGNVAALVPACRIKRYNDERGMSDATAQARRRCRASLSDCNAGTWRAPLARRGVRLRRRAALAPGGHMLDMATRHRLALHPHPNAHYIA